MTGGDEDWKIEIMLLYHYKNLNKMDSRRKCRNQDLIYNISIQIIEKHVDSWSKDLWPILATPTFFTGQWTIYPPPLSGSRHKNLTNSSTTRLSLNHYQHVYVLTIINTLIWDILLRIETHINICLFYLCNIYKMSLKIPKE